RPPPMVAMVPPVPPQPQPSARLDRRPPTRLGPQGPPPVRPSGRIEVPQLHEERHPRLPASRHLRPIPPLQRRLLRAPADRGSADPPQRPRWRSPEIQFRDVHLPAGPDRYPPAPPTVGIPAATLLRAAHSARDPQRADARRARPSGEGKHRLPPQTDPLRERRRP